MTKTHTGTPNASSTAITTLYLTSSSPPTASSPSLRPGTTRFAFGTSTPVSPPVDSLATHLTSFPSASVQTTDRSCLVHATGPSSSGTLSASASTTSRKMVTPSGTLQRFSVHSRHLDDLRRVSCVRFSPNVMNPVIVSCGWDKVVKVCFFFQHIHLIPLPRCDVIIYICYFRGLQPNETTIYHQDL